MALGQAWQIFGAQKATRLAAAIAFATIFSLIPLFVVLIAAGSYLLGFEHGSGSHTFVEQHVIGIIQERAGKEAAQSMTTLIEHSYAKPYQSHLARIIGGVTLLISATGLFGSLQDGLNAIWQIDSRPASWQTFLRDRLASFAVFVFVGLELCLLFLVNVIVPSTYAIHLLISLFAMIVAFSILFYVLPNVPSRLPHVILGAVITSILFLVGQVLIAWYFTWGGILTTYGAAGSIFVTLLWLYYSTLIFLFGASLTRALNEDATDIEAIA